MGAQRNGRLTIYRTRAAGFSLVELVVVVGIIALLISILLPALARVREAAKSSQCTSNLRCIGQALLMHADDHRQCLPLMGAMFCSGPDTPANLRDATMQKYDYFRSDSTLLSPTAMPAALAPYLGVSCRSTSEAAIQADIAHGPMQDLFTCPSDENAANMTASARGTWIMDGSTLTTFVMGYSSYCDNAEAFGFCPAGTHGLFNHSRAAGYLPAIGSPTSTMLFCDGTSNIGYTPFFDMWTANSPVSMADVFNGVDANGYLTSGPSDFDVVRHHGRINVLFVDGHVENVPILAQCATRIIPGMSKPSGELGSIWMDHDFPK
jgi:prepilin-type processing-associated H-X9-DG protein